MQNLAGKVLGQYELRELYGIGGMGAVYRAYQRNLGREVAFKVIALRHDLSGDHLKRFYREARTAAALEHPNIVPIHDYGEIEDITYMVMRLLTHGSLAQRLDQRRDTRPSLSEVNDLLKQLASALDYAHSKSIIHRDIKASNVMFDNHGTPYLVDFGIAKLVEDEGPALTASGMMIGTPSHMSPEQWRGEMPTHLADQYALGVMIYEMLTGQLPFAAPTPYGLMLKHLNDQPIPPHMHRVDLPEVVTLVIERALAKAPEDRFPTITALAQAFEAASEGNTGQDTGLFTFKIARPAAPSPSSKQPATPAIAGDDAPTVTDTRPPGKGIRRIYTAGVGLVVIVAVIVGVWLLRPDDEQQRAPMLQAEHNIPVFAGSDEAYAQITTLTSNTDYEIIGKSEGWYLITLADGEQGWVQASQVETSGELNSVEVVQAPTMTDTPPPSDTPSPTATPTETVTITVRPSFTPTETASNTPSITSTFTETASPTATDTDMPTATLTDTPTITANPSLTPTETVSNTPSITPTFTKTASPAAISSVDTSTFVSTTFTDRDGVNLTIRHPAGWVTGTLFEGAFIQLASDQATFDNLQVTTEQDVSEISEEYMIEIMISQAQAGVDDSFMSEPMEPILLEGNQFIMIHPISKVEIESSAELIDNLSAISFAEFELSEFDSIQIGDADARLAQLRSEEGAFGWVYFIEYPDVSVVVVSATAQGHADDIRAITEAIISSISVGDVEQALAMTDTPINTPTATSIPTILLENYNGLHQEAMAELEALDLVPSGGTLLFVEDYAWMEGTGERYGHFTILARFLPRTNIVMAGEITFDPGNAFDVGFCALSSRIVIDEQQNIVTDSLDVGFWSSGTVDVLPYIAYISHVDISEPHHLLYIAIDDRVTIFVDGEMVSQDFEVINRQEGVFGIFLSGETLESRCEGRNIWVYSF